MIRHPWAQQTQFELIKEFTINIERKLEFKSQAFNATNTPIFGEAIHRFS